MSCSEWEKYLKADPTDWLLEEDNPSVRFLTVTDLLGMSATDPEVKKAKADIMKTGIAPKILARQEKGGYWDKPDSFYTAKYKGSVWQLIILAELMADPEDERIKSACEFIIENSQDRGSGGFSMHRAAKTGGGRHSEVIPCLTGNMVWSLIRLGYLNDPRVRHGIEWITRYQRFDDRTANPPQGWPYDKYEMCWGRHTCHMGVVKAMKALSEIPGGMRTPEAKAAIERGAEYLLKHRIHKRSSNPAKISRPGWTKFGFPLMYQTDVLEILGILTKLGCRDERMQEAVDLTISKQDGNGRWLLESTFNGRFQADVEEKGKPSKWITLKAVTAIKRYYCSWGIPG